MTPKPKIQYVGQFYVHGSEARAIAQPQRRTAKTKLPQARRDDSVKLAVDPVALLSIAVAIFMLAVMAVGALRIRSDWNAYHQMKQRLYTLQQENSQLNRTYREGLDLETIRAKAAGMGLVSKDTLKTQPLTVTHPQPEPEMSWLDELKWFWDGLLE